MTAKSLILVVSLILLAVASIRPSVSANYYLQVDHALYYLTGELGVGVWHGEGAAALGFRGIGGQLHPVDGEHLPADQSLPIADREDLGEDLANGRTQAAHKVGERAECGALLPEIAMNCTSRQQAASIPLELMIPRA